MFFHGIVVNEAAYLEIVGFKSSQVLRETCILHMFALRPAHVCIPLVSVVIPRVSVHIVRYPEIMGYWIASKMTHDCFSHSAILCYQADSLSLVVSDSEWWWWWWWWRASCPQISVDLLGTNCDQCWSTVQCCFTSTETVRLIRMESPGRPLWLLHSSWTLWFWMSDCSLLIL